MQLAASILAILFASQAASALVNEQTNASPTRPALVKEALENRRPIYYFGLGSNMLRSKLENRGMNGTKIDLISMEPAVVPGHRLAFNMRGFPPLEPGMGSLEPSNAGSSPLRSYANNECHGALVLLTPENYEKVMESEGSPGRGPNAGYEEVVVDAFPYNSNRPVKAVALRARSHVRLDRDPAPSQRYMDILREGAAELGLRPCYQQFLAEHPTQQTPLWLRRLACNNLIFSFTLSSLLKSRVLSQIQSRLLFMVYTRSDHSVKKAASDVAMASILLPGAIVGGVVKGYHKMTKKELPVFVARLIQMQEQAASYKSVTKAAGTTSSTA